MCPENYKTFSKEIKEELQICKDVPCSWTIRLHIARRAILPHQMIYGFNAILSKSQLPFYFYQNWQDDPKIRIEMQGTQYSQSNFEKEGQNWRTHTSQPQNLKQYSVYWHNDREIDRWKRIECSEVNSLLWSLYFQ